MCKGTAASVALLWLGLSGAAPEWSGKVVEAQGEKVKIALEGEGVPRVGFQVEILSPDGELAGFWLVTAVRGGKITAAQVEALRLPQPGWKARVYDPNAVSAPAPAPAPWEGSKPAAPAADPFDPFGPPPPGAVVSTQGYLIRLPDGGFQEGFDNFRRWAVARGPARAEMERAYAAWKKGRGNGPFSGLWLRKNDVTLCQTYATGHVGAIVVGVCPGSRAETAGLKVGDLILKAGGEFVREPSELAKSAGRWELEVERDSRLLHIVLEPETHE